MIKKMCIGFHVKYPLFESDIKLEFSRQTVGKQIANFTKIRAVGTECFHAGGRTDVRKLIVAFRDFANAP
jgi:hypothetical protein